MEATKTRRKLGMHEKLLFDTICRQAGSLEKANVEGIMNSIEAGASAVYITLSMEKKTKIINITEDGQQGQLADKDVAVMNIKDDGRGIQNEKEIQEFFETFGTPHTAAECTTWKQFRMGRGQMFAYGKNIWRTSTFRMTVDIKNWGLEYEFESGLPFVEGCDITIELYKNPIGNYPYFSMESYKEAIQTQVRFVESPVFFNDEQINTAPSDCSWDKSNNNAYFLFNVGSDMLVYNLGVFVQKIPASKAGMGGVVVSRQQLKVNFARNDVMSDCKIYFGYVDDDDKKVDGILDIIRENRIKKTRQARRTLNQWERQVTCSDLRDGTQDLDDVKTLALIPTAQNKHVSLDFVRRNRQQWCFAPCGSDLADRMMEREQAICFDESILTNLNYTGHKSKFFSWLVGMNSQYSYGNNDWNAVEKLYADFSELSNGISDSYDTLPDKKMTVSERRIIKVLNGFSCWGGRVINLGYSERANAWTNGCTYITIDRSYLKRLYLGSGCSINKLMVLMAHEMAHDVDTRGTHFHGPEFYENMVDILKSNSSPTVYNSVFCDAMNRSKIQEKRMKEETKEQKALAKTHKKLGISSIAASVKS